MAHLHAYNMLKAIRNRSVRHYDILRSQDATGDLIYFLNLLGDIHVWPRHFWLENSLRLTSDCMHEHQYSRSARKVCARLKPGTCNGSVTPWELC